jgi:hypothetical protein
MIYSDETDYNDDENFYCWIVVIVDFDRFFDDIKNWVD